MTAIRQANQVCILIEKRFEHQLGVGATPNLDVSGKVWLLGDANDEDNRIHIFLRDEVTAGLESLETLFKPSDECALGWTELLSPYETPWLTNAECLTTYPKACYFEFSTSLTLNTDNFTIVFSAVMSGNITQVAWALNDLKVTFSTGSPTRYPSNSPSTTPTVQTFSPSLTPTSMPSQNPSHVPTVNPTEQPSNIPSENPSLNPSVIPTSNPTHVPSHIPTNNPSSIPSSTPTFVPSTHPSLLPTKNPSTIPTNTPTKNP